jgi:hypothetical protein
VIVCRRWSVSTSFMLASLRVLHVDTFGRAGGLAAIEECRGCGRGLADTDSCASAAIASIAASSRSRTPSAASSDWCAARTLPRASRSQGPINKAGNTHARRLLVEADCHHRKRYRPGRTIRDRWELAPPAARARGDAGNRRLHARWVKFIDRKKKHSVGLDVCYEAEAADTRC